MRVVTDLENFFKSLKDSIEGQLWACFIRDVIFGLWAPNGKMEIRMFCEHLGIKCTLRKGGLHI